MTDLNNLIVLEECEQAVLRAIILQLSESIDNVFAYDSLKAQKYLHEIGAFTKYDLTQTKQFEIIEALTNKGIISTDCICNTEFVNNYRDAFCPNLTPEKSKQRYYWLHDTNWAHENLQLNGKLSIEQAYKKHGGSLYVRMTPKEAKFIEENYISDHIVYLKVDKANACLSIKFGQEGEWHNLPRLDETKAPFKILLAAYKLKGKPLTTKVINRSIVNIGNKSLKTQVYSDNGTVKKLTPILIILKARSITLKWLASITPNQERALKEALKII